MKVIELKTVESKESAAVRKQSGVGKDSVSKDSAAEIVEGLLKKWRVNFAEGYRRWLKNPGWPAKFVSTSFTLGGKRYEIDACDLGFDGDGWGQGYMETVQRCLEEDLEACGAEDIRSVGFLD